jgi:hypothetical protein
MKRMRIGIAAAAAGTLLALAVVAGFAAHGAFAHAASASGGAARAVYCPDKHQRHAALRAFEQSEQAQKQAFFATHPNPAARKAFLEQQQARHKALVAAYAHCT